MSAFSRGDHSPALEDLLCIYSFSFVSKVIVIIRSCFLQSKMALALPSAGKPRLSSESTGAFLGSFLSGADNINIFDNSIDQNFEKSFIPLS